MFIKSPVTITGFFISSDLYGQCSEFVILELSHRNSLSVCAFRNEMVAGIEI